MTGMNCLSDSSTGAGCFLTHRCASLASVMQDINLVPRPHCRFGKDRGRTRYEISKTGNCTNHAFVLCKE